MPAKYIIVKHQIPSMPENPPVYYPRLRSTGEVNLRQIAEDIAHSSTVSTTDAMTVIESLIRKIPDYLADGKIVRLGELGSFYLSIDAESSPDAESADSNKIKRNKLNFRTGKLMKMMLKSIAYIKD